MLFTINILIYLQITNKMGIRITNVNNNMKMYIVGVKIEVYIFPNLNELQ